MKKIPLLFLCVVFLTVLCCTQAQRGTVNVTQCLQCWNDACSNVSSAESCCNATLVDSLSQCCLEARNRLRMLFLGSEGNAQCPKTELFTPLTALNTQVGTQTLDPGDYVVSNYQFDCNGCVESIHVGVQNITGASSEVAIYFLILREHLRAYEVRHNFSVSISENLTENQVIIATPNTSKQICFEIGDVLGFTISEGSQVNLHFRERSNFGAGVFKLSDPLESDICEELDNSFYPLSNNVNQNDPLIAVILTTLATTNVIPLSTTEGTEQTTTDFETTESQSTTDSSGETRNVSGPNTTPPATNITPIPMYVIIAGGVIAGVICLLLLLVLVVVTVCIVQRRHHKTVQFGDSKRRHTVPSAVSPIVNNGPTRSVSEIRSQRMEHMISSRTTDDIITIENTDTADRMIPNQHPYDLPTSDQMHHYHVLEENSNGVLLPSDDSYKYMTMYPSQPYPNSWQSGQLDALLQEEVTAYQDPTELASMQTPSLKYRSTVKNPLYSTSGQVTEDMQGYKVQAVYDEPHELMRNGNMTTNPQNLSVEQLPPFYHELENKNPPALIEHTSQGIYTETGDVGVSETPDDSPFGSQYTIPSTEHDLVTPRVSIEPPLSPNPDFEQNCNMDQVMTHHYHLLEEQEGEKPLEGSLGRHRVFERGLYVPDSEQRRQLSMGRQNVNAAAYDEFVKKNRQKSCKKKRFFEESENFWQPAEAEQKIYDQFNQRRFREIFRDQIQIEKHLGVGQFGSVSKGVWNNQDSTKRVAVKTLKPTIRQDAKVKFLQEAAIMGQFFHSNVVKLYGVVTVGEPVMIVMELMGLGDLNSYLWKNYVSRGQDSLPPPQPETLLSFCRQIACGMRYLARKHFVHRDLAARNILINETLVCKIGDFGMSRDLKEETYYMSKGGTVPIKWTAPEGLNYKKFSSASDVYSYGMVLYEIWSLGGKPLSDIKIPDVANLVTEGYCQPPPPGCPRKIYEVMVYSWNPKYKERPTFDDIFKILNGSDEELLEWLEQDLSGLSEKATQVGAPMTEARNLYKDLQDTYRATVV